MERSSSSMKNGRQRGSVILILPIERPYKNRWSNTASSSTLCSTRHRYSPRHPSQGNITIVGNGDTARHRVVRQPNVASVLALIRLGTTQGKEFLARIAARNIVHVRNFRTIRGLFREPSLSSLSEQ